MAYGIELNAALGGQVLSSSSKYSRYIGRYSANNDTSTTSISGISQSNAFAMWTDKLSRPNYSWLKVVNGGVEANSGLSGVTRYFVVYRIQ